MQPVPKIQMKQKQKVCPNCSKGKLRKLNDHEISMARENCQASNVDFHPAVAKICPKCQYLEV